VVRESIMNNWWIISDTHFSHTRIMEFCGRPEDHEDRMRKGLLGIPPRSVLVHLGDVGFPNVEEVHRDYIQPLSDVRTILVIGNHDRKSVSWYMNHGWDFVCHSFELEVFGLRILFSHKPRVELGSYIDVNIHGHFHNIDWRMQDPEFTTLKYTKRYLKFAVEETRYQPVKLKTFLQHHGRI